MNTPLAHAKRGWFLWAATALLLVGPVILRGQTNDGAAPSKGSAAANAQNEPNLLASVLQRELGELFGRNEEPQPEKRVQRPSRADSPARKNRPAVLPASREQRRLAQAAPKSGKSPILNELEGLYKRDGRRMPPMKIDGAHPPVRPPQRPGTAHNPAHDSSQPHAHSHRGPARNQPHDNHPGLLERFFGIGKSRGNSRHHRHQHGHGVRRRGPSEHSHAQGSSDEKKPRLLPDFLLPDHLRKVPSFLKSKPKKKAHPAAPPRTAKGNGRLRRPPSRTPNRAKRPRPSAKSAKGELGNPFPDLSEEEADGKNGAPPRATVRDEGSRPAPQREAPPPPEQPTSTADSSDEELDNPFPELSETEADRTGKSEPSDGEADQNPSALPGKTPTEPAAETAGSADGDLGSPFPELSEQEADSANGSQTAPSPTADEGPGAPALSGPSVSDPPGTAGLSDDDKADGPGSRTEDESEPGSDPFTGLKLSDEPPAPEEAEKDVAGTDEPSKAQPGESADDGDRLEPEAAPEMPRIEAAGGPDADDDEDVEETDGEMDESRREAMIALLESRRGRSGFKGFCPVVLRNERTLVDAKPDFTSTYNAKTYHFSSAEAKAKFDEEPAKYAPVESGNDVIVLTKSNVELEGSLDHAVWFREHLYMFGSAETLETFIRHPEQYAVDGGGVPVPEIEQTTFSDDSGEDEEDGTGENAESDAHAD